MTSELPVILQHWETGLQLDQRERKRFRIGAHNDEPAVRPQTLNAVHHGFGRVGSTENDVGTARCREALSVADNLIRAQSGIILSLSGECEIAMVSKPAAFAYCTARCPCPPIPSPAA